MDRRRLPLGIQTFRQIREEGCYYVDKTEYALRLVTESKHAFLSRPRRFGKSLFVDTLKDLFEGRKELFRALAIHDRWDWSARHPVVRLDFAEGDFGASDHLHASTLAQIEQIETRTGVGRSRTDYAPARFGQLIQALHESTGQRVVVLVDEYDKPILDALGNKDEKTAIANRTYLRGLFGAIKTRDAHIRLSFLTGVSKFSKTSLFSTLNNLDDLTLDPDYSAICGFTDADLDTVFASELPGFDRDKIRDWYNGYCWRGEERIYNPYDVLRLFKTREFDAHWYQTGGTPKFLMDILTEEKINSIDLDGMAANDDLLAAFDVGNMAPEALLFQTGYLTIREQRAGENGLAFQLGYPNREVRTSLNNALLNHLMLDRAFSAKRHSGLQEALRSKNFAAMETQLRTLFESIPYQWHTRNQIAKYEGYYASVCYSYFAGSGIEVVVEDSSRQGRLDMAAFCGGIYLFEIKVLGLAEEGAAMAQLRQKGYAEKYRGRGLPIYLVGVEFEPGRRRIATFDVYDAIAERTV